MTRLALDRGLKECGEVRDKGGLLLRCTTMVSCLSACIWFAGCSAGVEPAAPAERQDVTDRREAIALAHSAEKQQNTECSRLFGMLTAADTRRPLRRGSLVRTLSEAAPEQVLGQTTVRSANGGYEILHVCPPRDNTDRIVVEVSDLSCHRERRPRQYWTPQMQHDRAVARSPNCGLAAAEDATALLDMASLGRQSGERRRDLAQLGEALRASPLDDGDAARLGNALRESGGARPGDLILLNQLTPLVRE